MGTVCVFPCARCVEVFDNEWVRCGFTVSQAKTQKNGTGVGALAEGAGLATVMLRMASPVDEGFRPLFFYLPVCANGGLFSATTCGGADAFGAHPPYGFHFTRRAVISN